MYLSSAGELRDLVHIYRVRYLGGPILGVALYRVSFKLFRVFALYTPVRWKIPKRVHAMACKLNLHRRTGLD